jgi:hypothetical protein
MKKLAFAIIAMFFTISLVNAQEFQELKGPAAKNYKPWKQQARTGSLLVKTTPVDQQGPEAKNQRVWEQDIEKEELPVGIEARERVTGPEAKNKRPWKSN